MISCKSKERMIHPDTPDGQQVRSPPLRSIGSAKKQHTRQKSFSRLTPSSGRKTKRKLATMIRRAVNHHRKPEGRLHTIVQQVADADGTLNATHPHRELVHIRKYIQTQHSLVEETTEEEHSLLDYIRYVRDGWISTARNQLILLGLWAIFQVFLGAALLYAVRHATRAEDMGPEIDASNFHEYVLAGWMLMSDPGAQEMFVAGSRIVQILAGCLAVLGICFFSFLLGFIVDGIRERMEAIKSGRSKIVEKRHVLILGFSETCLSLIEELSLACESEGGGTVCILSTIEMTTLEAQLLNHFGRRVIRGTRWIVRTGNPSNIADLQQVSVSQARAIVVVSQSHQDADESDNEVLRTILSLRALKHTVNVSRGAHVVAEMMDIDNDELVRMVGGSVLETVVSHDIIGRLMMNAARQPGLADVFEQILGFEGSEFYSQQWPQLLGVKFSKLQAYFPDAIVCGIKRTKKASERRAAASEARKKATVAHESKRKWSNFSLQPSRSVRSMLDPETLAKTASPIIKERYRSFHRGFSKLASGRVGRQKSAADEDAHEMDINVPLLNPLAVGLDPVLEYGDEVIVIAEDDDSYAPLCEPVAVDDMGKPPEKDSNATSASEHLMLVGWRRDLDDMVANLDEMCAQDTEVHLVSQMSLQERLDSLKRGGLDVSSLRNLRLVHHFVNPTIKRELEKLPVEHMSTIMIMADETVESRAVSSDSRNLATLLLLRNIEAKRLREAKLGRWRRTPTPKHVNQNQHADQGASLSLRLDDTTGSLASPLSPLSGGEDESEDVSEASMGSPKRSSLEFVDSDMPKCLVICELVDSRTRRMIRSNAHLNCQADYLQTNNLVSRVLAMVVEKREFKLVLDELLGPTGNSFYLRNSSKYVSDGERLSFMAVSARIAATGQVLLGYKNLDTGASAINPLNKQEVMDWDNFVLIVMSNQRATEQRERPKEERERAGVVGQGRKAAGVKGPSIIDMDVDSAQGAQRSPSERDQTQTQTQTQMLSHHLQKKQPAPLVSMSREPRQRSLEFDGTILSNAALENLQAQMQMQVQMQQQLQQQMKDLQSSQALLQKLIVEGKSN